MELSSQELELRPSLDEALPPGSFEAEVNITGEFMGFSSVKLVLSNGNDTEMKEIQEIQTVPVKVKGFLPKFLSH